MKGRPPPKKPRIEEGAPSAPTGAQIVPLRPRNQVMTFGRYKGQPIELMLSDRSYCEWIAAQPWFREQFAPIYNIIVNGLPGEEQCTPEHNALQNLFVLDRHPHAVNLAKLLMKASKPPKLDHKECDIEANPIFADWRIVERKAEINGWDVTFRCLERWTGRWRSKEITTWRKWSDEEDWKKKASWSDNFYREDAEPDWSKVEWKSLEKSERYGYKDHIYKSENRIVVATAENREVTEYGEWKIKLERFGDENYDWEDKRRIAVELKPTLGDDYPAVLRQMLKRIDFHVGQSSFHYGGKAALVIGSFSSDVTTLEDLKAIFAQHDIAVVTLSEIEAVA
jgi:hypothetical protein